MIVTCDRAKQVWCSLGMWEKIQHHLETDRSGSVILEEIIRRVEQIDVLEVGFAELILIAGLVYLVGKTANCLWKERSHALKVSHGNYGANKEL